MATTAASALLCRGCLRCMRRAPLASGRSDALPNIQSRRNTALMSSLISSRLYTTMKSEPAEPLKATATAKSTPKRIPEDSSEYKDSTFAIAQTEILFKACATRADYYVPQAFAKGKDTPKTADGQEIGEGTGWWYESRFMERDRTVQLTPNRPWPYTYFHDLDTNHIHSSLPSHSSTSLSSSGTCTDLVPAPA